MTPCQILDQRMAALAKGNEVRSARAELKVRMHSTTRAQAAAVAARVVAAPDWTTETMTAFDLLVAIRSVGRTKAMSTLNHHGISQSRSLQALTARQRAVLLRHLSEMARG